jgi:hypothetical protein
MYVINNYDDNSALSCQPHTTIFGRGGVVFVSVIPESLLERLGVFVGVVGKLLPLELIPFFFFFTSASCSKKCNNNQGNVTQEELRSTRYKDKLEREPVSQWR